MCAKPTKDFPAREIFIQAIEVWRIANDKSQRQILADIGLKSRGAFTEWLRPTREGCPLISVKTMAKLTQLTGIEYKGTVKEEYDKYIKALKMIGIVL